MLKIGEFSRFSQVSVKALRFYDEIGLLRPIHIDETSGYRYYSASQLTRLNRILALKELGFTLEQIAPLLNAGLTAEQMRELLLAKQAEIQRRVQEEQVLLARVEARLQVIEQEGKMSNYEVVIKRVEPMRVAAIREVVPAYSAIGKNFGEVYRFLEANSVRPAGPCIAIWNETEYKEKDVDSTACCPIEANAQFTGSDRIRIEELPAVASMATVIHHGSYATLQQGYNALLNWIEANNYKVVGDNREVYLASPGDGSQTDESCVTEIQFAVEKA